MSSEYFVRLPGAWDVRHWIKIPLLSDQGTADTIVEALTGLPGMKRIQVYPKRRRIRVLYDQTQLDFQSIRVSLRGIGYPMSDSWWWKNKGQWFQYLDRKVRNRAPVS